MYRAILVWSLLLAACDAPCDDAAEICGFPDSPGECEGDVERFAECIVERNACTLADATLCANGNVCEVAAVLCDETFAGACEGGQEAFSRCLIGRGACEDDDVAACLNS